MKKKRIIVGALLATAIFGLAACNKTPSNTSTSTEPSTPTTTVPNVKQFDVKFYVDNSVKETKKVDEGSKVTKPADPSKTGYDFAGWYTDSACTTAYDFNAKVTAALNLYAKFNIKTFTVTFSGAEVGAQTVNYDGTVTKPADPVSTETGKHFAGWYTDSAYTTPFDFNTKVTSNLTLYANFATDVYTVKFEGATVAEQKVEYGKKVSKPANPTKADNIFVGWYTDDTYATAFDFNQAVTGNVVVYAKFIAVGSANLYIHNDGKNNEVTPITVTLDQYYNGELFGIPDESAVPATLEDDYRSFGGWYTDLGCTQEFNPSDGITEDTHIYAKWVGAQKQANFRFLVSELTSITSGSEKWENDVKKQIFVLGAGTEVRYRKKNYVAPDGSTTTYTHSVKMNGTNAKFTVNIPADGTLKLYMQNGSSTSASYLNVLKPDGTTEQIGYPAKEGTSAVNLYEYDVTAGTYVFTSNTGTLDIYDATFACTLNLSPIQDIEVTNNGVVEYIEGQSFIDNISASIVYENETSDEIDRETMTGLSVDTSALDLTTPGQYNVVVKYEVTEMIYGVEKSNTYSKNVVVNVYELQGINLGFNATKEAKNSYNGIYVNDTVQVVYVAGMEYDASALSVTAVTKDVVSGKEKTFLLDSSAYTIDNETSFVVEGAQKTITVSYTTNEKTKSSSYNVYVVAATPSVVADTVQVAVNPNYVGEIGAVVDGYNTFTSIQQALDFLNIFYDSENANTIVGKNIELKLAEGKYDEKIEINLPNMTIVGAGKETTIIEWNSLYGDPDESGYIQVTDSTATVAVREEAVNCTIKGVTISNYWNDRTKYVDSGKNGAAEGKNATEHRALAILIQADKFIMDDCKLLGMQDTIELFTGRQLIKNTYICGTTDFIFGTNNTTLFEGCTIEVKASEDRKSGGYVTAFKGANKGESDSVTYGAIFNACTFTAEADVPKGSVAIARPWGIYSAVAVLNSTLEECIAMGTTVTDQKNQYAVVDTTTVTTPDPDTTYYVVNGNDYEAVIGLAEWAAETTYYTKTVTASRYYNGLSKDAFNLDSNHLPTVKLYEYNNTGAGAMTDEELAKIVATYKDGEVDKTVRLVNTLTAEEAAKYIDQKVIFAKDSHKNVKYADNWAGSVEADVTVEFYYGEELLSTVKEYSGNKLVKPANPVVDDDTLTFDGWYADSELTVKYDFTTALEAGTVKIYAKFNMAETKTDTYSLDLSKVTGAGGAAASDKGTLTTEQLGNDFLTVVDSSKVTSRVKDGAVYCIENKDGNLEVTFKGTGTITISYCSTSGTNNSRIRVVDENGVACSATNIDSAFTYVEAETAYEIFGSTAKSITFNVTAAGTYTIDCVSASAGRGGRIYAIEMTDTYAAAVDKTIIVEDTTFSFNSSDSTATSNTYFVAKNTDNAQGTTSTIGNLTIDATASGAKFSDNGGSWFQFNTGTKLIFKVKSGAKVQLVTYNDQDLFNLTLDGAELTKGEDKKFTITADGTVTIEATGNGYVGYLYITYPIE
ncbi:MAG: pectinesterase family protein [Anaeroplasma sp.]